MRDCTVSMFARTVPTFSITSQVKNKDVLLGWPQQVQWIKRCIIRHIGPYLQSMFLFNFLPLGNFDLPRTCRFIPSPSNSWSVTSSGSSPGQPAWGSIGWSPRAMESASPFPAVLSTSISSFSSSKLPVVKTSTQYSLRCDSYLSRLPSKKKHMMNIGFGFMRRVRCYPIELCKILHQAWHGFWPLEGSVQYFTAALIRSLGSCRKEKSDSKSILGM